MAEDNAPAQAPKKKGKIKLILVLTLVVVVAVGLAVGATLWFIGGDIPGRSGGEAASDEVAEVTEMFIPSGYTVLDKALVTTVQAEGRQRYAQVLLALEAKDQRALDAAKLHLPLLRSQLIGVLAGTDFTELRTPQGRQTLADTLLETANGVLEQEGEPPLMRVLFQNFVVQ